MADSNLNTPASSSEVGQMFKLEGHSAETSFAPATSPSPAGLPIEHDVPIEVIEQQQGFSQANLRPNTITGDEAAAMHQEKMQQHDDSETVPPHSAGTAVLRVAAKAAPYLVVFAIGVGIYYFYARDFSFTSIFKSDTVSTVLDTKATNAALEALKNKEADAYNSWIGQFFFDVSDPEIIAMDTDVSGNGLTNFQKYLLNLNPKMYDTLGDGIADGQKILSGTNPWTGLAMTDSQKKIADAYFDNETINNRIAAAQADRSNNVFTPYVSNDSPYFQPGVSNIANGNTDTVRGNIGAVAGAAIDNDPEPATTNNSVRNAPLAGTSNDTGLSSLGIDSSVPGRIDIPSLKTSVPLVWSKDVKSIDADLKNGVVHYPGTPLPGGIGTSYISGHSSGYFWDKSNYKQAFAQLGNLKNGAGFSITVTLKGGKQAILHYRVDGRAEYAANDQRQFLQSSDSVVALSTCWPINTTARRLVIYGVLTQIEK